MPYARQDTLIWQKGMYYHIYNRGARQTTIFQEATNFLFVTSKIKEYGPPNKISVIAYCPLIIISSFGRMARYLRGNCRKLYSIVTRKHTIKCTHIAAHFLKGGFEPKPFKPVLICFTYADTFMETRSSMELSQNRRIGRILITRNGSESVQAYL